VPHAYNPSYSGGRDQEDFASKPAQANSSQDPVLKKTHHQKGLVAQGKGPEFKPQYCKNSKGKMVDFQNSLKNIITNTRKPSIKIKQELKQLKPSMCPSPFPSPKR
jgi:hypothetical protein